MEKRKENDGSIGNAMMNGDIYTQFFSSFLIQ